MIRLNELPEEILHWMLVKATIDMTDITSYIAMAERWGLDETLKGIVAEKRKQFDDLTVLTGQVLQAMGDIEIQKQIMSN